MGRDNQPRDRQKARDLRRRAAVRQGYKRLLIICEGEKTEPRHLNEIRRELRLARHLLRKGDRALGIDPGAFDHVYTLFDRDEHLSYHQALAMTAALDNSSLNDQRRPVRGEAVASVPCFEIWLLLRFEDVQAPIHRNEVSERLKQHLPGYAKGQGGHWGATKQHLGVAIARAAARAAVTTAHDGYETYTDMHRLVEALLHLKDQPRPPLH